MTMISSKDNSNGETFRGLLPDTLKFGTSGLRGLVEEMTDLEVYINAAGFLDYLIEQKLIQVGDAVCLAGDLRPSTDSADRSIMRAVAKAVEDSGLKVRYLGRIPTPALTAYALHHGLASIMVTGSHIPFDRNGIKFNKPSGEVLKSDESAILSAVMSVRRIQYAMPADRSLFNDAGWFKPECVPTLPEMERQAGEWYLNRFRDFLPDSFLKGRRLLVYQHSAVGRDMLVELLESFGATVIVVGRSDTFVPIDTEDISVERLNQLQAFLEEHTEEGKPIDALVSTDGDSDRPLVCGVDGWNRLQFLNGDLLGVLVADFLHAQAVVVPISANDAVDAFFADKNIQPYKTKIGSPHVIQTMNALCAQGANSVVGWEANGGFLTGSDIQLEGRKLSALPTRDAFLPILAVLNASLGRQKPLMDLMGTLPARFGKAGLIDAFPQESSRALLKKWTPDIQGLLDWELKNDGTYLRLNDGERRPATDEEAFTIAHLCEEGAEYFSPAHGYGHIQRINYIDGVRIYFDNGDIAHIRPSGNAPQLRFYAVANVQDRASAMVAHALLEPDGLLRSMEAHL